MFAKYGVLLLVLFVWNVEALDRHECSSHCTLAHKESAGCWNQTLTFFEEALLDQIRGYVLTQVIFWL